MNKKKAIEILNSQSEKLKKASSLDIWKNQTASFVKDIFGEESHEYDYIKKFNTEWSYTEDQRRRANAKAKLDGVDFLQNCIETVEQKGVYKKPKQNFLQTMGNATLAPVILFAVGAVFSGGMLYGKYLAEVNNHELRQEIQNLKQKNEVLQKDNTALEQQLKELQEKLTE